MLDVGEAPFLRMFVALLCTCSLAVLAVFALRALGFAGPLRPGSRRKGVIKIEEQTDLSATHSLYLVQIAGRYLLLGGTSTNLSTITELDKAVIEAALKEADGPAHVGPSRGNLLARLAGKA